MGSFLSSLPTPVIKTGKAVDLCVSLVRNLSEDWRSIVSDILVTSNFYTIKPRMRLGARERIDNSHTSKKKWGLHNIPALSADGYPSSPLT